MSTAEGNPTAEELARHARWVRRLAGALLRDEGAAEDLVQEAWVAALTRPPRAGRLRPWLRQVARNFASRHQRGTARRAAREAEARAPAGPEAPDAFAERLESEQRLTRALAALAEPFRAVLMLRYYEDLEPAQIAARLGLPRGTVRWRLARGLALLRERLDHAHGGDRRAWSLALLPLARLDGPSGLAAAVELVTGFLAMNALKLSVAAAALLVLGLSLSGVLPESLSLLPRRETPLAVDFRPLEPGPGPAPVDVAEVAATTVRERAAPSAPAALPAPESLAEEATLDARFLGQGRPLAGAQLVVHHAGRRHAALAGADGHAAVAFALGEPRALVRVELHAFGCASRTTTAVCEAGRTTHLGALELAPGGAVSGRIVDARGVGLAGARVSLGSLEEPYPRLEAARLEPAADAVPATESDAGGRFRLLGVPAGMVRLWAHAPEHLASYSPPLEVRAGQESTGVELLLTPLAPEHRLRGIVLDPSGAPVPGAELAYRHELAGGSIVRSGSERADRGGRFEFLLPDDARTSLTAKDPEQRHGPAALADLANGAREHVLQLRSVRRVELAVTSGGAPWLGPWALELVAAEGETRLGSLARAEHPEGRAAFVLPGEPFRLRVLAAGHRVAELGPLDPARVGDALRCALERVPGLAGIVLAEGAPAAGVRVTLRAAVAPDTELEASGYRLRVWPEVVDEATSDAEGRFLLTPRAAGSYYVRAEPAAGAPAELGPLQVDEFLGGPPLELHLGQGGAIEGRVRLAGGADPEGAIVGITRGDGGERTQRVARDGRFRFEALIPGPWRVELRTVEVFGPPRGYSSTQSPRVKPFDLKTNCTVHEGETSYVDVSDVAPETVAFEGRLTLDGRPAIGWSACLGPAGRLDFEGEGWSALDGDGRFALRAPAPGEYRLILRQQGGEHVEQYLFEDVLVRGVDAPWERELHTGKLLLEGLAGWMGEGVPRAVHHWKGAGGLFAITVPVGDGQQAVDVPAGPAELRAPSRSFELESWKLLRTLEVRRGETLRVRLTPEELGGG